MPKKKRHIEIRSEEVQEILGKMPTWIIRNGIVLIFIIIALLFTGSWVFKYPDVIHSTIVITSSNPPATLIARSDGKITHFFVADNQNVKKGNYLAIIENPANYQHVIELKKAIKNFNLFLSIKNNTDTTIPPFKSDYSLGELQMPYASFLKGCSDYIQFFELNYYPIKINAVNEEIDEYNQYILRLYNQMSILEKDLDLALKDYKRDSVLFSRKIIAQAEFEKIQSNLFAKQFAVEQSGTSIANTRINVKAIETKRVELKLQFQDKKNQLFSSLKNSHNNLLSRIDIWEQAYVLKSPIEVTVTFTSVWSINQNVRTGDKVLTIVPNSPEKIIGKLALPIERSGKVKTGQKVNIKFVNYPHMEYGIVQGEVKKISLIPADNYYTVEVSLPHGLKTNYGKELVFAQELKGNAEIITENIRLIQRILFPIKSLLKKNQN